jgi:uncharacterized membrane protein YeaQ/YmgE (transglycosylase-associated protein family)
MVRRAKPTEPGLGRGYRRSISRPFDGGYSDARGVAVEGSAQVRPQKRVEVLVGIVAWIVLGAIAGYITNLIMGGKEGVIETIILGIVGAVVGGFIGGSVLKVADVTGLNPTSIVVAVIGAVIVVAIYRAVTGRRQAL